MTRFRPCIDLHSGQVKQIVGGTLSEQSSDLQTNHVSPLPASHFARLYREKDLQGAHVIMLGPGNEDAAQDALSAWPRRLQIGGGINERNAARWIERGAEKVIVTSYLFPDGKYSQTRLDDVLHALGNDVDKLVIDLSCRRQGSKWTVAMNKWQTLTDMELNQGMWDDLVCPISPLGSRVLFLEAIKSLEPFCSEFLIHAADNEGLQRGIDEGLVRSLGHWCSIPVTYAGGGKTLEDLDRVRDLSRGKVDLTIGSALDIFGGSGVKFNDCVAWH